MVEMKDSGVEWIGNIPVKWNVDKVKYHFTNYKIIPGIQSVNYKRLALTLKGVIFRDKNDGTGLQPKDFYTYQLLKKNDLVFKLIDLQNISTSRIGLAHATGLVSPAYIILKSNDIVPEYAEKFFLMMWYRQIFNALGDAGVRSSLNVTDLLNVPFIVPSLDEQKKIARFIDIKCSEIDALHTDIEKQIETLEEYKKSIITEAVTEGLDPDVEMKDSGISYVGNIPKHWKVTNLKYLGKCQNGISKGGEYFGNGFPFVSYGDVYKNYSIPQNVDGLIMSTKTEQNIYSVKYGDVFFTRTSETIEEIGFASTCLKSIDNSVFAGFLIRFRPTSSDLIPEFSKFYFRSNIHRKFFVKEMNLVTRASLSQNLLGRLPVLLPPLCEQQMIAINLEKKCAEIDGAIEEKKEQLETLEQYKKSLIYEYVTGKKEVK